MKSIVIQFHSKISEILEFVERACAELNLSLTVMTLSPFRIKQISTNDDSIKSKVDEYWWGSDIRFALNLDEPNLDVSSPNQYLDENQGSIFIDVGRETTDVLGESALMFRYYTGPHHEAAKQIAKRLKAFTKSGVIAINPDSGDECFDKSHRYTDGAKNSYENGTRLAPVAGKSLLKIA